MDDQFFKTLPTSPGVYVMEDAKGTVLYVGKAGNLRSRVRNYFVPGADERPSVRYLILRVNNIRTILTDTEKEALILENNLIKEYRPKYNVNLRDDKSFFSLRLNQSHPFPRLTLVRTQKITPDGAKYFGPYSSARDARVTLKLLHSLFPLRQCTDRQMAACTRPCLNCQMKKCLCPCTGKVSSEEYGRMVRSAVLFLQGRSDELINQLRADMQDAAARLSFEEAALIRDLLAAVQRTVEKQNVSFFHKKDQDAIAVIQPDPALYVMTVLSFRQGNLLSEESFVIRNQALDSQEVLSSGLRQYYDAVSSYPQEVLISEPIDQEELVESWLSGLRGNRVSMKVPVRGQGLRLIALAKKNAHNAYLREKQKSLESEVFQRIAQKFQLRDSPKVIEVYDISNTSGARPVGVKVSFVLGKPDKSRYRRYKIRGFTDQNDPAMIYQVVARRMTHQDSDPPPDLLVVDGGKAQLNAAIKALESVAPVKEVPVAGIAKARNDGEVDLFYLPKRKNPVLFKRGDPALLALMRMRDEAHRFAHSYHSQIRANSSIASWLDTVPGIGPKKKQALLRTFGSVKGLLEADDSEILRVPGIGPKDLERIRGHEEKMNGKSF